MESNTRYGDIGQRIRRIRGPVTQKDFARLLGIHRQVYLRYESGERAPSVDVLKKIARYGQVTIDWILTGEKEKKGPIFAAETGPFYLSQKDLHAVQENPQVARMIKQVLDIWRKGLPPQKEALTSYLKAQEELLEILKKRR